ncbi:uncharacterized protein [Acropora muricata]|uniref:uncharacterized protein isoform X1 n=1 Tax=Acropora muricata TaxID=159855 RepID=UPI0034E4F188
MPLVSNPPPPDSGVPVPVTSAATTGMAGALVLGPLNNTQASLSGESQVLTELFSSPSLPIDARVSEKLRAKIWNNEFFDFSSLLSNPVFEDRFQLTISNSDKEKTPSLCLEPVSNAKKHLSIETWLSCFHVFVGVYTSKRPHEAPALMKYGKVVRDLAARGGNWKFYDENFLFLRQAQPASFPWGVIHWELWMRAQHSFKKHTNPAGQGRPKQQDQVTPKGTVSSFTGGWLVLLDVPLNIYVSSVRVHTQSVGVIFVAKVDTLQPDPCLPSPILKNNNLPTPVIVERLDFFLSGYNHSIAVFLSSGFGDGFPSHYEGDPGCSGANNLISAIENPDVVDGKISKELIAGRLAGPFRTRPFYPFRISPLGVVPKKIPGEFRLIHH